MINIYRIWALHNLKTPKINFPKNWNEFISGVVNPDVIPRNLTPQRKRGRKRNTENDLITEKVLEENRVSIDSITGGMVKRVENVESGTVDWEVVDVKSLVRDMELSEEEKKEILGIKMKNGKPLFKNDFLLVAKKIKSEFAKGHGRPKIVKNLRGIKGASDGNVGKCIAAFNRAREKEKRNN